jgi:hypothetical protein
MLRQVEKAAMIWFDLNELRIGMAMTDEEGHVVFLVRRRNKCC